MVKTTLSSVVALLPLALGCGGAPAAPAPAPAPEPATVEASPGASAWPQHFAALEASGVSTLAYEDEGAAVTISATVVSASPTSIELRWTRGGAPFDDGLPTTIERDGETIRVAGTAFAPGDASSGAVVETRGDVVCYTDGPAPDAGDCSDICFATACFHPEKGLVHLGGNWAPLQFSANHPDCDDSSGALVCN